MVLEQTSGAKAQGRPSLGFCFDAGNIPGIRIQTPEGPVFNPLPNVR
jgi:hypothetical protein